MAHLSTKDTLRTSRDIILVLSSSSSSTLTNKYVLQKRERLHCSLLTNLVISVKISS